jgi:hypothetical protein
MDITVRSVATWAGLHGMITLMNSFHERLVESRRRVNDFAFKMWKSNVKMFTAPNGPLVDYSQRNDYVDDGDLFVLMRVEHKVLKKTDFTCRDDFPHECILIDEKYKVDNKNDKPLCYVIENRLGTHCGVVYYYTKKMWEVKRYWDSVQDRNCEFYAVNKKSVRFCKIDEVF